jgi:hypothetical protein
MDRTVHVVSIKMAAIAVFTVSDEIRMRELPLYDPLVYVLM